MTGGGGFPLHLLRHGALETPGLMVGHSDPPPRSSGLAACVARTRDLDFARIISSDLSRARLAAEAIAMAHGVRCHLDPRWRELNFGAWEGAHPATLPQQNLARFWDDPDASPPPGGESWQAIRTRVAAAVAEIDGPTLVVTHAGAMRAALACLLGFDLRQCWGLDLPYAALLSLRVWPGSAQIVGLAA